jgi:DNA-directed RNA polymerase specialized sigma24 family protein
MSVDAHSEQSQADKAEPINNIVSDQDYAVALNQYAPLINRFVYQYGKNHTSREDIKLLLESELYFALKKHDPKLSALTTFVFNRLRWAALNAVKAASVQASHEIPILNLADDCDSTPACFVSSLDNNHEEDYFTELKRRLTIREAKILDDLRAGVIMSEIADELRLSHTRVQQLVGRIIQRGKNLS